MGLFAKLLGRGAVRVEPAEAQELLRQGALMVDVREKREWEAGHVRGAKHHPLGTIASVAGSLPHDRTIVVACRSGGRSARAARLLRSSGLDVVDLAGGLTAWHEAGLPLVSAKRGRAKVV
jgi:rhodanese-related sulfurtransferase